MSDSNEISKMLGGGPAIIYSPKLARKVGSQGAIIVGQLGNSEKRSDRELGALRVQIVEETGLSESVVHRTLASLQEAGLIHAHNVDYHNYYKLNWDAIEKAVSS